LVFLPQRFQRNSNHVSFPRRMMILEEKALKARPIKSHRCKPYGLDHKIMFLFWPIWISMREIGVAKMESGPIFFNHKAHEVAQPKGRKVWFFFTAEEGFKRNSNHVLPRRMMILRKKRLKRGPIKAMGCSPWFRSLNHCFRVLADMISIERNRSSQNK